MTELNWGTCATCRNLQTRQRVSVKMGPPWFNQRYRCAVYGDEITDPVNEGCWSSWISSV